MWYVAANYYYRSILTTPCSSTPMLHLETITRIGQAIGNQVPHLLQSPRFFDSTGSGGKKKRETSPVYSSDSDDLSFKDVRKEEV